MNTRFLLAVVFAVSLIGLYASDRALRRMGKTDDIVLKGQTGLPWLDDLFSRRAAAREQRAKYEAELKRLLAVPSTESLLEKRIEAHYAVARFASAQGHGDSEAVTDAWLAIVREGNSLPQTREAWRALIERAAGANDRDAMKPLIEGYFAAVTNSAVDSRKLFALLDVWHLSTRHGVADVELGSLEMIHAQFPSEPDALEAFEALAQAYRRTQQMEKRKAVEESARQARALLIQRSAEEKPLQRSKK